MADSIFGQSVYHSNNTWNAKLDVDSGMCESTQISILEFFNIKLLLFLI